MDHFILAISLLFFHPEMIKNQEPYNCAPFITEIDTTDTKYSCLNIRKAELAFCYDPLYIENNCDSDFYFYNNNQIDKNTLFINSSKLNKNRDFYFHQAEKENIWITDNVERDDPKNDNQNIDNKKLNNGQAVKNWEIKLYSIENNEDVFIKGKTVYNELTPMQNLYRHSTYILLTLYIIQFLSICLIPILLLLKFVFKVRTPILVLILLAFLYLASTLILKNYPQIFFNERTLGL